MNLSYFIIFAFRGRYTITGEWQPQVQSLEDASRRLGMVTYPSPKPAALRLPLTGCVKNYRPLAIFCLAQSGIIW
jgi:hypothetical protein